jgi:NAD(P)-dependent dehydrogenase (short-subunit alcohol dehydrogenase family)
MPVLPRESTRESDDAARSNANLPALANQVALVTGATRGLGLRYARRLLEAGMRVALLGRRADAVGAACSELDSRGERVLGIVADARDGKALRQTVERTVDRFGRLDLAVANAGVWGPLGRTWEVDAREWWEVMELHVGGSTRLANAVLPVMERQGSGRIVLMASHAGVHRWPLASAYSVSKAAVIKLAENLAVETRSVGVKVFSMHPGLTEEGLTDQAFACRAEPGSAAARLSAWVRGEVSSGRYVPAAKSAELLLSIARGELDERSGSYLDAGAWPMRAAVPGVA